VKALALILAVAFFVLGMLYGLGKINFLTASGGAHEHHVSHLIILWFLALLCLIWFRFQSQPATRR